MMAGDVEIARLAHLPGVNHAGAWRWAVKFGDHGFAESYADALAALTRSWVATRRSFDTDGLLAKIRKRSSVRRWCGHFIAGLGRLGLC